MVHTHKLNNNIEMPVLGLGTWQSKQGSEAYEAVKAALDAGYRHIDTAAFYGNEDSVGEAIRDSDVDLENVFVTTKLWTDDQGFDSTLRAFDTSMDKLGMETLDLYLIHWPNPAEKRMDTWKAFERLYDEGRIRAIGVSNYMTDHLDELMAKGNVPPAVNQIELHPWNFATRRDVVAMCQNNDIAITAYSPLAQADHIDDPQLVQIAEKYDHTPAQVILRWLVQQGVIVIPKSVHKHRIEENSQIFDFEINEEDIHTIMDFNTSKIVTFDPTQIP